MRCFYCYLCATTYSFCYKASHTAFSQTCEHNIVLATLVRLRYGLENVAKNAAPLPGFLVGVVQQDGGNVGRLHPGSYAAGLRGWRPREIRERSFLSTDVECILPRLSCQRHRLHYSGLLL